MPGTSLRTANLTAHGNRPMTKNGRPISCYAHPTPSNSASRKGTPTTSSTSHFTRLATALLVFSGDEQDITSINVVKFARSRYLSRILVDYLIQRLRDPITAANLAAEYIKIHGFDDWWWKNRLGR